MSIAGIALFFLFRPKNLVTVLNMYLKIADFVPRIQAVDSVSRRMRIGDIVWKLIIFHLSQFMNIPDHWLGEAIDVQSRRKIKTHLNQRCVFLSYLEINSSNSFSTISIGLNFRLISSSDWFSISYCSQSLARYFLSLALIFKIVSPFELKNNKAKI